MYAPTAEFIISNSNPRNTQFSTAPSIDHYAKIEHEWDFIHLHLYSKMKMLQMTRKHILQELQLYYSFIVVQ